MDGDEERARVWTPTRVLTHASGAIALGIALLYVIGAVAKVGEVTGAGFHASTIVPNIPIQQLLALGVSTVATPKAIAGFAVITAYIVVATWIATHLEGVARKRPHPIAFVIMLVVAIAPTLALPPGYAPAIAASFVIYAWLWGRPAIRLRSVIAATLVVIAVTLITVTALVYPAELPSVTVVSGKTTFAGKLLATTDGSTVVGLADCRIEIIPAAQIASATITSAPRRKPRSLWNDLLHHTHVPKASHGKCA